MARYLARVLAGVALLAGWGCAAAGAGSSAEGALLASVQATLEADTVHFVLQVTNTREAPAELVFPTGQSFDFAVSREGREVWRWSADRAFTQAVRSETLPPGGTRTHEAAWRPPPGASGEYVVVGTLTTMDRAVEQAARFRIP